MYSLTVLWFLLEALRESRPSSLQRLALLGSAGIAPISASVFPGLLLWVSGLRSPPVLLWKGHLPLLRDDLVSRSFTATRMLFPNMVVFTGSGGWNVNVAVWGRPPSNLLRCSPEDCASATMSPSTHSHPPEMSCSVVCEVWFGGEALGLGVQGVL